MGRIRRLLKAGNQSMRRANANYASLLNRFTKSFSSYSSHYTEDNFSHPFSFFLSPNTNSIPFSEQTYSSSSRIQPISCSPKILSKNENYKHAFPKPRINKYRDTELIQDISSALQQIQQMASSRTSEIKNEPMKIKMEFMLEPWDGTVDNFTANNVIKNQPDASIALAFFRWVQGQKIYRPDPYLYTTLISVFGRSHRFSEMEHLLDEMRDVGLEPSVVTFNAMIKSYGSSNQFEHAKKIFDRMKSLGIAPSTVTYGMLMGMHVNRREFEVAMDLYKEMKRSSLSMNTMTSCTAIQLFSKIGKVSMAESIFHSMQTEGNKRDVRSFNLMMDVHAKAGDEKTVVHLFSRMKEEGLVPNNFTFNIMLSVYLKLGMNDNVVELMEDMKSNGVKVDIAVYNTLIRSHVEKGSHGFVEKVMKSMDEEGIMFDDVTYSTLLLSYLTRKEFQKARWVIDRMRKEGLLPSLPTYNSIFFRFRDKKNESEAGKLWELMEHTNEPIHGLLHLLVPRFGLNQTMHSIEENSETKWEKATPYFEHLMAERNQESKDKFVMNLLDFLCQGRLRASAGQVWEEVRTRGMHARTVVLHGGILHFDFRTCFARPATIILCKEFLKLHDVLTANERNILPFPESILVHVGSGKSREVSRKVRLQPSVSSFLQRMRSPFSMSSEDEFSLAAHGRDVKKWLLEDETRKILELKDERR